MCGVEASADIAGTHCCMLWQLAVTTLYQRDANAGWGPVIADVDGTLYQCDGDRFRVLHTMSTSIAIDLLPENVNPPRLTD